MNLAFFASYNGSSAHAITDACLNGDLIASPVLLITNNKNAKALEWAEKKGLKTVCLNSTQYPDPAELDKKIAEKLEEHNINMVCLSGYMKLIGSHTMNAVHGKILNTHPALLPKYGGKGMYGNHVHEAVKNSGDKETGCTIHQVNEEYDEGKILAQKIAPVLKEDSVDDIADKVKNAEPDLYIETIDKILKDEITLD